MGRGMRYGAIAILVGVALLLSPLAPLLRAERYRGGVLARAEEAETEARGSNRVLLPLTVIPPGPPVFEIVSPAEGWVVSGMINFAAQPATTGSVSRVTFRAGLETVGVDDDPSDGFRLFLDTGAFPAGPLALSAVASGPGGEATRSVTVTVVPDPPSSGMVGPRGVVLATEIGSVITVPPGALPEGTSVTVEEKTQEEITAENGIDWEAIGVTFLGHQSIQAGAESDLPLAVASAGFGNRVQPGQAVLNYTIVPDVDGDGVDELVMLNGASVAPNDDVLSDPVPQVQASAARAASGRMRPWSRLRRGGICGPPGTLVEIEATGFNAYSARGNVATFHSAVDGSEVEAPVALLTPPEGGEAQTVVVPIPFLPPGPATLTLRNESTGSTLAPVAVMVEAPPPLSGPPEDIIDEALASLLVSLEHASALAAAEGLSGLMAELARAREQTSALRDLVEQTGRNPTPEEHQLLLILATLIENSGAMSAPATFGGGAAGHLLSHCSPGSNAHDLKQQTYLWAIFGTGALWTGAGLLGAKSALALGIALSGGALLLLAVVVSVTLWYVCSHDPPPPPPPQPRNGGGNVGMGSAPPPGGPVGGNILPDLDGARAARGQEGGRYTIKLWPDSGASIPFTGLADRGGYFFIPWAVEGEPFRAVAYDSVTGDCREVEGVGAPLGEATLLTLDFSRGSCTAAEVRWDGGGDGASWYDPLNWENDTLPGINERVIIDAPGEITVIHRPPTLSVSDIVSLHSEENIELSYYGYLELSTPSIITGGLTMNLTNGSGGIKGTGDLTVQGPITWRYGTMEGTGRTIANGGIFATGGGLIGGRTLDNAGTVIMAAPYGLDCSPCIFNNLPGALVELQDAHLNGDSFGEARFYNEGRFTKNATGATYVQVRFINRGRLDMLEGRLIFSRGYIQEASGTMRVEIGGRFDYDQYTMVGLVGTELDGTLEIALVNNYEPQIGDTFQIITHNSTEPLTGQFATIEGQEIGNGKRFDVIYNPGSVVLEVVPDP